MARGEKKKVFVMIVALSLLLSGCTTEAKIRESVSDVLTQYNSGSISYEKAIDQLDTIYEDAGSSEKQQIVTDVKNELSALKESKDAFVLGNSLLDKKSYTEAIKAYKSVSQEDGNYQEAQTKLKEASDGYLSTVYEQADKYLEKNKFDQAIDLFNKAKQVVNTEELDKKIEETQKAKEEARENNLKSMKTAAEEALKKKDYKKALSNYKSLFNETHDEGYSVLADGVIDEWIDDSIVKAEKHLKKYECDKAESELTAVKNEAGSNKRISDEEKRIEEYRPVDITYLDPIDMDADHSETWFDERTKDNIGNEYQHPFHFAIERSLSGPRSAYEDTGYVNMVYFVDGKYDTLSGVFALEKSESFSDQQQYISIYADDKMVYQSPVLLRGDMPIDVSASILEAKKITIRYSWKDMTEREDVEDYYQDYHADVIFGNVFLYKKIK